GAIGHSSGDVF
nr:immunoglobulin light chain junction region [Macaca mulatta]MPN68345.1 immunoglobulin light chain junction region [Macaca mulatta]